MSTLPQQFLATFPRLQQGVTLPGSEFGTVTEVASVSSVTLTVPLSGTRSLYGAVNKSTVVQQGGKASASGDMPAGGSTLEEEEIMALPGSTEFLEALNQALLDKWSASLTPIITA
jgi:hypothetical protein